MFGFLYEGDAPPGAGGDVGMGAVEGPLAPQLPPPRRRGRDFSQYSRLRRSAAHIQHYAGEVKARSRQLLAAIQPSTSSRVAQRVFGAHDVKAELTREQDVFIGGEVVAVPLVKSDEGGALCKRGSISFAEAQCGQMAKWLARTESFVEHLFSTNIFDDASMWLKDPGDDVMFHANDSPANVETKRALRRRGGNVFLPVLNNVEALYLQCSRQVADPASDLEDDDARSALEATTYEATEIHTPARVLPTANATTVRCRLNDWAMNGACGSGKKIDPDKTVERSLDEVSWKTVMYTRDNLALNDCIIHLEEAAILANRSHGVVGSAEFSQLSLPCCSHSCVLPMKQLMDAASGLPSQLLRLAHIRQSGKSSREFRQHLTRMINERFRYKLVDAFPEEHAGWQEAARRYLRVTRPARDLTLQQEDMILLADNGNWSKRGIYHFCVRGECKLGCNQSAAVSKRLVRDQVLLSVDGATTVPLLYRWKGFEECNAKNLRGRLQHHLVDDVIGRLYPEKKRRKVEQQVAEAALTPEAVDDALKRQVRGHAVAKFFRADPDAKSQHIAAVLNGPLQHYLNACFKAEQLERIHFQAISARPPATEEPSHVNEARAKSAAMNLGFIDGSRGKVVVKEFSQLILNLLDAEPWLDLKVTYEEKCNIAPQVVVTLAEAWWRLCFKFQEAKFEVLVAGAQDKFDEDFVQGIAAPLFERQQACQKCVDPFFGELWIARLMSAGESVRRRAWRSLRFMLASLKVMRLKQFSCVMVRPLSNAAYVCKALGCQARAGVRQSIRIPVDSQTYEPLLWCWRCWYCASKHTIASDVVV